MYKEAKIAIGVAIALIVAGMIYAFRDALPSMPSFGSDDPPPVAAPDDQTGGSPVGPKHDPAILQKIQLAEDLLAKKEYLNARSIAENVLLAESVGLYDEMWLQAADVISKVNTVFLFSDVRCPEKERYVVQSGDSLARIANKFNTTVNALQRSNGLDATNPTIYPKQSFYIYKGDWQIRVIKENYLLVVTNGDRVVKTYLVAIGRNDRTPTGTFTITDKQVEPDWWQPGRIVKYGDPENVLGTRWMSIEPVAEEGTDGTLSGFGIHGTWEPDSIGSSASLGCVRMRNEQVEDLFDIVPYKTRVIIQERANPEAASEETPE
ncbi:MAG: lipoprotein-anchoring transpeptidase ErfK/SrfK [Rhodothermales bacterium]|jgi:lipoprotein-anchoring transpeptidase ErfK/SrfK